MIRVLHVIDSLDLGGAQTALLNLLRYRTDGFHHEVATMHGRGIFAEAFEQDGVPVHSLSAHRWPPEYLRSLPALLDRGQFDIVHFHLFGSNWIAKPLAALCGARILINHDQCNDAFRSENPACILVDAFANQLSTHVIAVSGSIVSFLVESEGISPDQITLIPNSVDLTEFQPPSSALRDDARQRFDLPADAWIVGGVGRFTHQKHFDLLIDAFLAQSGSAGDLLVLFGEGPDEDELRTRARSDPRIRFMGRTDRRFAMYHAIDVLAMPSRYEGTPLTVLEAMASGVPVVSSAVDGILEFASHRDHALLFENGDADGLGAALVQIRIDPESRKRIVNSAIGLMRDRFDARKLAAMLETLYRSLVNHATEPLTR